MARRPLGARLTLWGMLTVVFGPHALVGQVLLQVRPNTERLPPHPP